MEAKLGEEAAKTADVYLMLAGGPVVVMVSGGADSIALLLLFAQGALAPVDPLIALHVDHSIREDSAADASFVASLCERLGVGCVVERVDVPAFAREESLNLEDAGRKVRYRLAEELLDEMCAKAGADPASGRIAVAHTADDVAETMLMRLVAGSAMSGLASIRPVRDRVIRPLIDSRRAAVRDWLESQGQEWREDPTNADTTRLRSLMRHEVLPLLEGANPAFVEAARRSAAVLAEEDALLDEMASAFVTDFRMPDSDLPSLDLGLLQTLSRPMVRRVLRLFVEKAYPGESRLEAQHLEALAEGVAEGSFAHEVPGGIRVFEEYGSILISRAGEVGEPIEPVELQVPGEVGLGQAGRVRAEPTSPEDRGDGRDEIVVDADRLRPPLVVDRPRPGDRIRPFGMEGTKKVSDLLIDEKIPARARQCVPVVRDANGIVWIAGVRMGEEVRVTERTKHALRLTWQKDSGANGRGRTGGPLAP